MKKIYKYLFLAIPVLALTSCGKEDPNSPGTEFMPDMYRSTSYETNGANNLFTDSMANRTPVKGTISIGNMPYPYLNDSLGYELAGHWLRNPIDPSSANIDAGKELYGKFCIHCHGESGQGDGKMVASGKYPAPPPSYSGALKMLPEGKMMHTLQYGKNMMGSHASQLSVEERWKIVRYVQTLQGVDFTKMSADSVYLQRSGRLLVKKEKEEKKVGQ